MFWLWRRGICRPHVHWTHKWNESYRVVLNNWGGRCWSWACWGFPQGYLSLQVGNQLETHSFTQTLEDVVVYCVTTAEVLMLEKESPRCKPRGQNFLMSGKESTWCNTERIQKLSLCGTQSRNADEKGSPKARGNNREEVAAYNPYPLHKALSGLYILKVHISSRLFGDIW